MQCLRQIGSTGIIVAAINHRENSQPYERFHLHLARWLAIKTATLIESYELDGTLKVRARVVALTFTTERRPPTHIADCLGYVFSARVP
jgi:hypothetical protein